MAHLALQSGRYVATVIEGHMVREIIDFDPFDWFVLRQCCGDLLDLRRVPQNLRVAVHACARRGYSRHSRLVRSRVAVETLNLVIARVNFVRKVNWLGRLITLLVPEAPKERTLPNYKHSDQRNQERNNFSSSQTHRFWRVPATALLSIPIIKQSAG